MPPEETVLVQAQRLLAHAREVEQSCHDFYAREAEREEQQEERAPQEGSEDGTAEEA